MLNLQDLKEKMELVDIMLELSKTQKLLFFKTLEKSEKLELLFFVLEQYEDIYDSKYKEGYEEPSVKN